MQEVDNGCFHSCMFTEWSELNRGCRLKQLLKLHLLSAVDYSDEDAEPGTWRRRVGSMT